MDLKAVMDRRASVEQFLRRHRIGMLTLVFTDIVGSTRLKEQLGDSEAVSLIQEHHASVREILGHFKEGEEISTAGDSFFIIFSKPSDAVKFTLQLQAGLRALAGETSQPILDRIGIHVGEVLIEQVGDASRPKDLYGIQVDTCARVMSLAEGGQVLLSRSSFDSARQVLKGERIPEVGQLAWLRHGLCVLKGLDEPIEICEVGEVGCAPLKPPPDAEKGYRQRAPVFTRETGVQAMRHPTHQAGEGQRNLSMLRDRVKQFWIDGILEKSAPGHVLLSLSKRSVTDAVEHPWERVLELPDHTSQVLPAHKRIGDVFEELGRSLLILGEPGSGKTITLLELARDLIARSQEDPSQPVPAVFNLSNWNGGRGLLADWLIEELQAKYYVPTKISQPWLEQNCLVVLLDGLDEVRKEHQLGCVEAINRFVRDFGVAGLVICSRLVEYTALPVRLKLNGAVCLQPLTPEQIDDLLANAGPPLAALHTVVNGDAALQELARTPLMLSVMGRAYEGISPETLADDRLSSPEARRKHIFDSYVQRMLERKGKGNEQYPQEQTRRWLAWLAVQMGRHSQSLFLIEQLQPSWLLAGEQRWFYFLSSRLWTGMLLAIYGTVMVLDTLSIAGVLGLTFGLLFGLFWVLSDQRLAKVKIRPVRRILVGLGAGLLSAWLGLWASSICGGAMFLIWGPACGLALGLLDGWRFERRTKPVKEKVHAERLPLVYRIRLLISGLVIGLIGGLGLRWGLLLCGQEIPALGRSLGQPDGKGTLGTFAFLLAGLLGGLLGGMIISRRHEQRDLATDVEPVESLIWAWAGAGKGCLAGLLFGSLAGLLLGFSFYTFSFWPSIRFYGSAGACIGLLFGGLRSGLVETRTRPNQGMRLTLRNTVIGGLTILATVALVPFLDRLLQRAGSLWLGNSNSMGSGKFDFAEYGGFLIWVTLVAVPAACAWYGGMDLLRHYTLRLVLFCGGFTARSFAQFLDHCVKLILLRKVGGGYVFIHRLVLEHFAETPQLESETLQTARPWALAKAVPPLASVFCLLAWFLVHGVPSLLLLTTNAGNEMTLDEVRSGILPRDPRASPSQINLATYYNVLPTAPFQFGGLGCDLSLLPQGLVKLAGTEFDVRGVVQLADGWLSKHRYPREVLGVSIGLKCRRFHFLHASGCGSGSDGTQIGKYVVHYADGQQREIPIVYGRDVRDWFHHLNTPRETEKSTIAWTGSNKITDRMPGVSLRLFKSACENPRPDMEIKTIDYVSTMRRGAPFLVAITIDE